MTRRLAIALALLLLVPAVGLPQGIPGTLTQQAPTLLDACTGAAAANTSAATITITPPAGQSVYLCSVQIDSCSGSAAVTPTNPASVTTTNLSGSPKWFVGTGAAAGLCQPTGGMTWPRTLKSSVAGTPVTIVLPSFATNQTIAVNAYYFFAP